MRSGSRSTVTTPSESGDFGGTGTRPSSQWGRRNSTRVSCCGCASRPTVQADCYDVILVKTVPLTKTISLLMPCPLFAYRAHPQLAVLPLTWSLCRMGRPATRPGPPSHFWRQTASTFCEIGLPTLPIAIQSSIAGRGLRKGWLAGHSAQRMNWKRQFVRSGLVDPLT